MVRVGAAAVGWGGEEGRVVRVGAAAVGWGGRRDVWCAWELQRTGLWSGSVDGVVEGGGG